MKNSVIALLGLSGCGKSYWSKRLEKEAGFQRVCCDSRIETQLFQQNLLTTQSGLDNVARWMGQPFSSGFAAREQQYLDAEAIVVQEIVDELRQKKVDTPCVIDLSGSFIYLADDLCLALRQHALIVYFDVPEEEEQRMFELYLQDPKPVIWKDSFRHSPGENDYETLQRCYPHLLDYRAALYTRYADVTLPFSLHRAPDTTTQHLLREITPYAVRKHPQ